MTQIRIGRIEIVGLLAVGFAFGGVAVAIAIDVASDVSHLKDWQTFIAGILALAAAVWTVREMRAQTAADDARASRDGDAVFNVISARLKPLLDLTNVAWKAIDETIAKERNALGSSRRAQTACDVYSKIGRSIPYENFSRIAEMRAGLNPEKQVLLFEIEETFKEILKDGIQMNSASGVQFDPITQLNMARVYLSYLVLAVDAFNTDLVSCFDGRVRTKLELRGDAELTQETVDQIFAAAARLDAGIDDFEGNQGGGPHIDTSLVNLPISSPNPSQPGRT